MTQKRILLVGLDPALVTFRPGSGRTADQVTTAGDAAQEQLTALGYVVQTCLLDLGATAESVVLQALSRNSFDCIMIGAGLRALPEHTALFEKIINLVHQHAPAAKLCFNTNPGDTVTAVLRWV